MEHRKIYSLRQGVLNNDERAAIAYLLVKAGYTVRMGKERPKGKTSGAYIYFIEYWEE